MYVYQGQQMVIDLAQDALIVLVAQRPDGVLLCKLVRVVDIIWSPIAYRLGCGPIRVLLHFGYFCTVRGRV